MSVTKFIKDTYCVRDSEMEAATDTDLRVAEIDCVAEMTPDKHECG